MEAVAVVFVGGAEAVVILAEARIALAAYKVVRARGRHQVAFKSAVYEHFSRVPAAVERGNGDYPAANLFDAGLPVEPLAAHEPYVFVLLNTVFKDFFGD